MLAGLLAFLLFLPNLLWNIQHHFPFLELQENIRRSGRNVSLSLASFFGQETLAMLPLSAADLDRRTVVAAARALSRTGLRVGDRDCPHPRDEPAHLLPLPRIPHALCRGRRPV